MRKTILLGAICLVATVVMAGSKITPMNVKTGYWQDDSTFSISGAVGIPPEILAKMTPEQRSRYEAMAKSNPALSGQPRHEVSKGCLTEKDLNTDPFQRMSQSSRMKCDETVIRSTGTDLEVKTTCLMGTSKSDMHLQFHALSSEHVVGTGEGTMLMGGRTEHSNIKMDMKWLGSTCPKDSSN